MAKKQISRNSKSAAPVGVKILSVLSYIGAVLSLLAGIFIIFAGGWIIVPLIAKSLPIGASSLVEVGTIILGILFILFAVLDYFIGKGLWKGQNWARIVLIVLCALSLISSLAHPLADIVGIIINAVIIWYLGFSDAKKYFN
jgi:hypothetical protein